MVKCKEREDHHVLRRASETEVEGVRPRGTPKMTWTCGVEAAMREMNIGEETADNRRDWERLVNRPTEEEGRKMTMMKERMMQYNDEGRKEKDGRNTKMMMMMNKRKEEE